MWSRRLADDSRLGLGALVLELISLAVFLDAAAAVRTVSAVRTSDDGHRLHAPRRSGAGLGQAETDIAPNVAPRATFDGKLKAHVRAQTEAEAKVEQMRQELQAMSERLSKQEEAERAYRSEEDDGSLPCTDSCFEVGEKPDSLRRSEEVGIIGLHATLLLLLNYALWCWSRRLTKEGRSPVLGPLSVACCVCLGGVAAFWFPIDAKKERTMVWEPRPEKKPTEEEAAEERKEGASGDGETGAREETDSENEPEIEPDNELPESEPAPAEAHAAGEEAPALVDEDEPRRPL